MLSRLWYWALKKEKERKCLKTLLVENWAQCQRDRISLLGRFWPKKERRLLTPQNSLDPALTFGVAKGTPKVKKQLSIRTFSGSPPTPPQESQVNAQAGRRWLCWDSWGGAGGSPLENNTTKQKNEPDRPERKQNSICTVLHFFLKKFGADACRFAPKFCEKNSGS